KILWKDWFGRYSWQFRNNLIGNEMFLRATSLNQAQIEYLRSAIINGFPSWRLSSPNNPELTALGHSLVLSGTLRFINKEQTCIGWSSLFHKSLFIERFWREGKNLETISLQDVLDIDKLL